jgi:hypothetical protein
MGFSAPSGMPALRTYEGVTIGKMFSTASQFRGTLQNLIRVCFFGQRVSGTVVAIHRLETLNSA